MPANNRAKVHIPRTWVMLIDKNILSSDAGHEGNRTPDIVKLQHPRTKAGAMFLFSADNSIVQEVFSLPGTRNSSWFIDESYIEDGKLYFSAPIDPLFLVLPYLKEAKEGGKVIPLEHLLVDKLFPEVFRLLHCPLVKNLDMIADRKGDIDLNAWAYNEEKVMSWLSKKAENVAKVLEERNIPMKGLNHNDSAISDEQGQLNYNKEEYLLYACGLVSEYLTDDLRKKLHLHLNLESEVIKNKSVRKRWDCDCDGDDSQAKKFKEDPCTNNAVKKQNKSTGKQKQKVEAPAGCKSITSFFKKK